MKKTTKPSRFPLTALAIATLGTLFALAPLGDKVAYKGSPYPLPTCPVSGKELTQDAVSIVVEDKENPLNDGREIRLCCPGCVATFKAEQAKFLAQVDAAIIAQQKDRYPLTHCLVMTEDPLPLAGQPDHDKVRDIVVLNTMVRICCPGCTKKIKKDPEKFVAQVDAAIIAKQKSTYPLTTCPISGEALDADAADVVVAGRLVRLCCKGCAEKAYANSAAVLAKLDSAEAKKAPAAPATPAAGK